MGEKERKTEAHVPRAAKVHSKRVARHFAAQWAKYDEQIRTSIPFYDEALGTLVRVIEASGINPERILDLGVGTGNLAASLLQAFPQAHLTGIDLVQDFLDLARTRLSGHQGRVSLQCMDVADFCFANKYELVVTSFMFHHLKHETKLSVMARVFDSLVPYGCFVNADFVDSASPFYSRVFEILRIDFTAKKRCAKHELVRKEYLEHRKLELPVPMETQLQWLRDIGFVDTECFWKYLNLAILCGRTPVTAAPEK